MIRLIVGLGNPGPEYEGTRHNAGFWWVDAAARQLGGQLAPDRAYHGLVARVNRPDGPVWLLQPMTFMNLSGKAVAPLARFFKITPDQILVVHDELDLPPGQMKIKQGGGTGGHNGLKDIQAQLGTGDYWRLRLGIGHPGVRAEVVNYVLRKPPADERDAIERNIEESLKALDLLLAGAMDKALAKIHAKPPRPNKPAPVGAVAPPVRTAVASAVSATAAAATAAASGASTTPARASTPAGDPASSASSSPTTSPTPSAAVPGAPPPAETS
jgi:peptidyl-tRNA hydrolase, PTH1 family